MDSLESRFASFFKIFHFGLSSRLGIPAQFVKKYGEMLPQISNLETESGKFWDAGVKQHNGQFYITDGWPEFVKGNQVREGDFLVFSLLSRSTLQVVIYGMEGCPREPSSPSSQNTNSCPCTHCQHSQRSKCSGNRRQQKLQGKPENDGGTGHLMRRFSAVVRKHNTYVMEIPRVFAIKTGISGKSEIKLQNSQGKEWQVDIIIRKTDGSVRLSTGWCGFREANGLEVETHCWFEFDPSSGNLIVKQELGTGKRERGRPQGSCVAMVPPNRGRGRPPKIVISVD